MCRSATAQARQQNLVELHQIKEKLALDGCPMTMAVLQNAIMIPGDLERPPFEKAYPAAVEGLMKLPENMKIKKKKKGKKGKKK